MTDKIKIVGAYYRATLPDKLIIERPDGEYYTLPLQPMRAYHEDELTKLEATPPVKDAVGAALPSFLLPFYGLEKVQRESKDAFLHIRLKSHEKQAFAQACYIMDTTPSEAVRGFINRSIDQMNLR